MSKRLKIAMVVIDGNDVSGDFASKFGYPSPAMHPTIQALIDGLAKSEEIECRVLFGSSRTPAIQQANLGAIRYVSIPYQRIPCLGMGGSLGGRFLAIRRYVREWAPDIVHGQGTERESGLVAAHAGRPSVLTLHGNFRALERVFRPKIGSYYWTAARLETHVLSRIDHIICISRYVEDLVSNFTTHRTLIPNAVSRRFLEIESTPRASPPRVVCLGSIDMRKRTSFILEACELLWRRGLQFTFHVYGDCGFEAAYSREFQAHLQPWIEQGRAVFEGFARDPAPEISQARVMVSASCEESFGMNVLEAMACGTPAVGPDVGGIRDIIRHGETGFLYPMKDVAACADFVARLINEDPLWERMSAAGRTRAGKYFSEEKVAATTIDCYKRLSSQYNSSP